MILRYLKDKRRLILSIISFGCIFSVVFYGYGLPQEAVGYGVLLCGVFSLIIGVVDYFSYSKKYRALQIAKDNASVLLEQLPNPADEMEKAYTDIIYAIDRVRCRLASEYDGKSADMLDYYTLWVHQIKTPIAAMSLLLQQGGENPILAQELFKIEQYAQLALEYLRIESMSSDMALGQWDLEKIVNQAIKKYASLFIYKKIKVIVEIDEKSVLTDEKWLTLVVEQIISNSLKYTNEGWIRLCKDGDYLVIQDSGIGISSEDLPRVFERGFTGFNGRMNKKSTGLGLYLCKKVCDKLGHEITVASSDGKGTTVKIKLKHDEVIKDF